MSRVFRIAAAVVLVTIGAVLAHAQLNLSPTSFTPGQVISSSTFSQLFANVNSRALNREGGTLTGHLLFSPDGSVNVGASGANRPGDLFVADDVAIGDALTVSGASTFAALSATNGTFSGTLGVTGATTLTATLAVNSTSASAIDVAGGITAGSGNVGIVGTDGRIPAISSTYFASLSGANLTGIPETAITDGSLLARYAEAAPFTGTSVSWTESNNQIVLGHLSGSSGVRLQVNAASGQSGFLTFTESGVADRYAIGINAGLTGLDVRIGGAGGTLATRWEGSGNILHQFGLALTGVISPAALASGNTNDYSPTSLSTAFRLRVTPNAGGSVLTGLAAQADGAIKAICKLGTNSLTIASEDANSSAANRFAFRHVVSTGTCPLVQYDATSQRWYMWGFSNPNSDGTP